MCGRGVGTDGDYLRRVVELEEMKEKRLFVAEVFRQYELRCAEEEFERERLTAQQDFEVSVNDSVYV